MFIIRQELGQGILPQEQKTVLLNSFVGSSVERIDMLPKVTGKAIYTRDIYLPRMLWGKIKRCPWPHARIKNIDISKAMVVQGIRAVIVGKDFPPLTTATVPALSPDEILYSNQAVAAVAADNKMIAETAVELIDVEYEQLPAVFDARIAMSPSTPCVIKHVNEKQEAPNISSHLWVKNGDVEGGFEKADRIFENTFTTPAESHFELEPLTCVARPDLDGGITIWTTGQPHKTRFEVANYIGLDQYKIRVNVPFLGGWFGGKEESHVAAICAMLAIKSGRPVKLELTREETTTATGIHHSSEIHIKDGVRADGRILARKIEAIYNGGAYGGTAGAAIMMNNFFIASLYDIPNFQMDVYRVYTNKVPGTPRRGPAIGQMTWAEESQMDNIARGLNIDPAKLRQVNILHNGDENALGEKMESLSHEKCIAEVIRAIEWDKRRQADGPWRWGKGVALSVKGGIPGNPHQAKVVVRENGQVEVHADLVENGVGILTTIQQLVATEFSIPLRDVIMLPAIDGTSTNFGISSGATGSRQLVNMGNAVLLACHDAKRRLADLASKKLSVDADLLEVREKRVYSKNDDSRSIEISALFNYAPISGGPKAGFPPGTYVQELAGYGTVYLTRGQRDQKSGKYVSGRHAYYYVNAAQAIELKVNVETGIIKVERIAVAMDVGRAINPDIVRGQMVGQVHMSLSETLGEELNFSDGRITNANLADYKILTSNEMPLVVPIIIETPYTGGPLGAKGAGEACMLSTPPAVRNALYDAVSVWVNDMPITPDRVLDAIINLGLGGKSA
jgi:CO/xanthine dehydrogenase Mo-binding subunit